MKNNNGLTIKNRLSFDDYKKVIDDLILNNKIDKLKLQEDYFDITSNYWIVDRYIAKNGQCSADLSPNALSSYEESINNGYAISIPVQSLDDGNIVCFSHKNISKVVLTTSGYLNNLTLEEVKGINLNQDGDKIPTLEEALDFIANRTQVIIEIQNDGMVGKIEDKILSIIQKYINKFDCYQNIAIMSINPYTLQYCFNEFPYITRILKSGNFNEKLYGSIPTKKLKKLKYYKITQADYICYSHDLLPSIQVEKHKPVGVIAYNVTTQNQYLTVAPHADNIIFSHFKPTI